MAQSENQLKNLKRGNPDTQFKPGRDQVEISKKANDAKHMKSRRRKSLAEAAQAVAKLPLNEHALRELKKKGILKNRFLKKVSLKICLMRTRWIYKHIIWSSNFFNCINFNNRNGSVVIS